MPAGAGYDCGEAFQRRQVNSASDAQVLIAHGFIALELL